MILWKMEISARKFNPFNFFDYKILAWKEYIEIIFHFLPFYSKLAYWHFYIICFFVIKWCFTWKIYREIREGIYGKCINRRNVKDFIWRWNWKWFSSTLLFSGKPIFKSRSITFLIILTLIHSFLFFDVADKIDSMLCWWPIPKFWWRRSFDLMVNILNPHIRQQHAYHWCTTCMSLMLKSTLNWWLGWWQCYVVD